MYGDYYTNQLNEKWDNVFKWCYYQRGCDFCLLSSAKKEYKVVFKEAVLLVKRVSPTMSAATGIDKPLEKVAPNM